MVVLLISLLGSADVTYACCVIQALPSQASIVSPAALLRHVSSTRAIQQEGAAGEEEPWNQDLLQALLAAIYKVAATALHCTRRPVLLLPSKDASH